MSNNVQFYTDGEIEDILIETLKNKGNVFDIPYNGGAVFHNFTDARENLLNWYSFRKEASVLEIGAGMGALTGLLSERCAHVTAFEHSPKRAEIIRQRYADRENIEVVCGDIFEYEFLKKFDYILMIGVLEYMGINSESQDPYTEILNKVGSLLSAGGILLIAIENRFGLKYWCGAAEDHTGIPFDGISGYKSQGFTSRYHKKGVRTFGKEELNTYLSDTGFSQTRWYYPLPDYKFPNAVYSDTYLPQVTDIEAIKFTYPIESQLIADEREVYQSVIKNNVFPFFANSFLVEASKDTLPIDYIKFASLKRDYKSQYRIGTIIDSNKNVIKMHIGTGSDMHLKRINYYVKELEHRGVRILGMQFVNGEVKQNWQDLPRADVVFRKLVGQEQYSKANELLLQLKQQLICSSECYLSSTGEMTVNGYRFSFKQEEVFLIDGYIDMTFANSFYNQGELIFFDQEWRFENVPVKFILYRAVKYACRDEEKSKVDRLLELCAIDTVMKQKFDEAEAVMLSGMMDSVKCKAFDANMYHDALTLKYKLKKMEDEIRREQQIGEELKLQKKRLEEESRQKQLEQQKTQEEVQQLKEKNQEIQVNIWRLEEKVQEKDQSILNQKGHIELLLESEREFEREKASKTYRLALCFRKMSTFLLPVNSKRRFFVSMFMKAVRHPRLMLRMLNPRRIKNCFIILKTEGVASAFKHLQLVEEYEKSREVSVDTEKLSVVPVSDKEKCLEEYEKLVFPQWEEPEVSIVIPVYNQFDYTWHCLESILKNSEDCRYEIIIGNDCSTDLTSRIEEIVSGIKVITHEENLRFLLNCNKAAEAAKGKYILFLNNDTQVQPGWLKPLTTLLEQNEKIGMIGSKLLYADGYLQEAGGILWKDASAWNYGNRQNPNDAEFNYVREVDYISGAAIMIRTELWKEIGGFDTRYVPAYCEDSDLAFEVRKHGYQVVYQPKSVVVHFEGISNGTDLNAGQKKYQVENQKKFYDKWKPELEQYHFENGTNVILARERSRNRKHVLVIDHYVPQYDKDAGSKTTFMYLKMLVQKGYQITFLGDNFYQHEPYTTELQQMGIFVLYGPKYAEHWKEWLCENINCFDVFYLNRPHISIKYIDFIREHGKGKIIYYGHDLHFLRIQREYELTGAKELLEEAQKWKEQELYLMRKADMVYYPSETERMEINKIDSAIPVKAITAYVYEQFNHVTYNMTERQGMLFVGGFGHGPNLDAVKWFLDKIFPQVYEKIKAPFYIVGSKAPDEITQIDTEGVIVKGFVSEEELQRLYHSCRMAVVPLRYGAGVKGKVVEALYYGIPVITTSVGAEGIGGIEEIAVVKDCEEELIQAICKVYDDEAVLSEMSNKSQEYAQKYFSTEAVWNVVKEDFG